MEYALRLAAPEAPGRDARAACPSAWRELLPEGDVVALYFGTEFCEDRIPTLEEASAYCALARLNAWQPTLLTPLVSDDALARLDVLLAHVAALDPEAAVVFNDWGVLDLLRRRHAGLARRAGRLMNRSLRDPRAHGDPAYGGPAHDGGRFRALRGLLVAAGVCAMETDPDLEGGFLAPADSGERELQRVLHVPFTFAASGRNCPLKAALHPVGSGFTKALTQSCPAPCRGGAAAGAPRRHAARAPARGQHALLRGAACSRDAVAVARRSRRRARGGDAVKVLAPLSSPDEVAPLIAAGADELYCGITPPGWAEAFGGAWVHRRNPRTGLAHARRAAAQRGAGR